MAEAMTVRYENRRTGQSWPVDTPLWRAPDDLGPVAATIQKDHHLRVDICGAYFPLFDRNTNTGEGPTGKATRISTEKVFHRPGQWSRIILPCTVK